MSTIIQSYPFRYNADETDAALRFPDLSRRSYSFNIQIADAFYIVIVTYNIWTNNAQVSVYTSDMVAIALNMALIEANTATTPNYLANTIFAGYGLIWDRPSQQFIFYSI